MLRRGSEPAVRLARPDEEPGPRLVVTVAPDAVRLATAIDRVPPGGWLYIGSGRARRRRSSIREVRARLQSAGFVDIRRSWHWPSESASLEIAPLDHPPAVRVALARRRNDRLARIQAGLAAVALRVGVLDRIVPGWSVVAHRPDGTGAAIGPASPDVFRWADPSGDDHGILLLTPRFRASRHVIGLVVGSDHGDLAAVVKVPRLADDDSGIRREEAALRRAGELGARGVPAVIATHGSPRPALVESALDGRVIAGRELRADARRSMDEIEAWTRTLAGAPDRPLVALRTLWEPAVTRLRPLVEAGAAPTVVVPGALDPATIVRTLDRTERTLAALDDIAVPVVLEHGDLAPPNLLRRHDGSLGIVDWEVADTAGLALGDLLFFAAFLVGAPDRAGVGRPRPALPPDLRTVVDRQAVHLGLDPSLVPAMALVMWIRWVDRQAARFADPAVPAVARLPARHVRSWAAAVGALDGGG